MGVFTSAHIHMSLGMSKCASMSICCVCPQCLHLHVPVSAAVRCSHMWNGCALSVDLIQTLVGRPEGIQQHLERTDAWSWTQVKL